MEDYIYIIVLNVIVLSAVGFFFVLLFVLDVFNMLSVLYTLYA